MNSHRMSFQSSRSCNSKSNLLRIQRWPLVLQLMFSQLRLRTNGCNNSQQCWDLQCIVGRIQPISLCKPCVMSVRGPNNVGRAVQTDPTLLRYASAITEKKKCWELLAESLTCFKLCATTSNNMQQGVQTDATCNIQQCWELLTNNAASVCTRLQVTIYPVIHISSCRAWLQVLMLAPTGFYQLARISGYKASSLSQFAVPNLTLFKMYLLTFFWKRF